MQHPNNVTTDIKFSIQSNDILNIDREGTTKLTHLSSSPYHSMSPSGHTIQQNNCPDFYIQNPSGDSEPGALL